jgi:hypothetical protein
VNDEEHLRGLRRSRPDLTIAAIRRPTWPDGSTADAVIVWDDLKLGLFVRKHRLVLARWNV